MTRNLVATIAVFDKGYESDHPRFQGNRIVKEWKIVIKIPGGKTGQKLDRYKRRDTRQVLKKKGEDARAFDPTQVIIGWLESLRADFEVIEGEKTEIRAVRKKKGESGL